MTIPAQIPSRLVAGDTWQWTRELVDYPRTTWTATYYLENHSSVITVAGTGSAGSVHSFDVAAADTAAYAPGRYQYRVRVTDGTTVRTVEKGELTIEVNPAAAGTHDTRTWARRTLDALEARIEGRATRDQLSMSINGRSISFLAPAELMDWRDRLRAEVRAEELGANAGLGRNIRVRFDRA